MDGRRMNLLHERPPAAVGHGVALALKHLF
jgi:hypothetical protein